MEKGDQRDMLVESLLTDGIETLRNSWLLEKNLDENQTSKLREYIHSVLNVVEVISNSINKRR